MGERPGGVTAASSTTRRVWWLPTSTALVFLLLAVTIPGAFGWRLLNSDGDLARHLRQGKEILSTGQIIRTDRFSWINANGPFVSFEYGSQVVFALVERYAGLAGIVVLASLLLATTHALIARFVQRRNSGPILAISVAVLAALVGQIHWIARPHLVTLVLSVVLLEWLDRDLRPPWWRFAILFLVWANLHAGFLFGLALIAIWLAGEALDALRDPLDRTVRIMRARELFLVLVASGLVTFLNAYGPWLHLHAIANLGDQAMKDNTSEFLSPDFHWIGAQAFLAAVLVLLGGALMARRRIAGPHLLLIVATVGLALMARRNITLFAVTALPVAALHLFRSLPGRNAARSAVGAQFDALGSTWPWIAVTIGGLVVGTKTGLLHIPNSFDAAAFPVQIVRDAREAGLGGRLFNDLRYGGYVQYAWPEQRVSLDGATDVYGGARLVAHRSVVGLVQGWHDSLRLWEVELVLMPVEAPLVSELARSGAWTVWKCDATAALLSRRPGNGQWRLDECLALRLARYAP